jgi:hypothetical protein
VKALLLTLSLTLLSAAMVFGGLTVLMAGSDNDGYQTMIVTGLSGFSDFDSVDWWNIWNIGQPVLSDLTAYDCVVTWSNYPFPDPTAWGNTLADYVDGGGKVILCPFCWNTTTWGIGGDILTSGYSPFTGNSGDWFSGANWELTTPDIPGHYFLTNVNTVACGYRDYVDLAAWGVLVTHYIGDNEEALAVNTNNSVAAIDAYPGQSGSPGYDWTGDLPQCMRNVIVYMCTPTNIQPTSLGAVKAMFK